MVANAITLKCGIKIQKDAVSTHRNILGVSEMFLCVFLLCCSHYYIILIITFLCVNFSCCFNTDFLCLFYKEIYELLLTCFISLTGRLLSWLLLVGCIATVRDLDAHWLIHLSVRNRAT